METKKPGTKLERVFRLVIMALTRIAWDQLALVQISEIIHFEWRDNLFLSMHIKIAIVWGSRLVRFRIKGVWIQ